MVAGHETAIAAVELDPQAAHSLAAGQDYHSGQVVAPLLAAAAAAAEEEQAVSAAVLAD